MKSGIKRRLWYPFQTFLASKIRVFPCTITRELRNIQLFRRIILLLNLQMDLIDGP